MKIWFRVAGEVETLAVAEDAPAVPRVGEIVKIELKPDRIFEGVVECVEWQYAYVAPTTSGEAGADAIVVVSKRIA